jgi:hypothetical protein
MSVPRLHNQTRQRLDTKTHWLTEHQSRHDFDFSSLCCSGLLSVQIKDSIIATFSYKLSNKLQLLIQTPGVVINKWQDL